MTEIVKDKRSTNLTPKQRVPGSSPGKGTTAFPDEKKARIGLFFMPSKGHIESAINRKKLQTTAQFTGYGTGYEAVPVDGRAATSYADALACFPIVRL
ncbi:hypothetical protein ACFL4K_00025 [Candidatus Neomarinimicrobiota bacterium]